jgi:hypothetical protein
MAYKLNLPERKSFSLDRTDAKNDPSEEPTRILIRQATVRQNMERARLFSEYIRESTADGGERVILRLPLYDLVVRETFLTLVDCNIQTESGALFQFRNTRDGQVLNMNFNEFQEAWGRLPEDVVMEIHEKVLEVNPHWRFNSENTSLGES